MITIHKGTQYEDIELTSDVTISEVRLFNPATKEYAVLKKANENNWYISSDQTAKLTASVYTLEIYGDSTTGKDTVMLSSVAKFAMVEDSSMFYSGTWQQ